MLAQRPLASPQSNQRKMKPKYVILQPIITTTLFLALVALQSPALWGAEKSKEMKVPPISESSEADALQLIKGCVIEICSYPPQLSGTQKARSDGKITLAFLGEKEVIEKLI